MRIVSGLNRQEIEPCTHVVAVGAFDGVHRGHQLLLEYVCRRAHEEGVHSAIFTFEPIPAQVFRPREGKGGLRLTLVDERNELLQDGCPDLAVVANFDKAFRSMSAHDFARDVLVGTLHTTTLVASQRHTFGRNAEDDVTRIEELGQELGFEVAVLDQFTVEDGEPVTSTRIRKLLWAGEAGEAARLLGRLYSITGGVRSGRGVGRTLGFPTANVDIPAEKLVPAEGIYAAFAETEGLPPTPTAVNLGPAPTFEVHERLLEAHLITDQPVDLVGRALCVELIERLRGVRKFENPEALKAQIAQDVAAVQEACAQHDPAGNGAACWLSEASVYGHGRPRPRAQIALRSAGAGVPSEH